MVKLVDVAKACGLSVSQTSRALNGRQDVSEETKRRVSRRRTPPFSLVLCRE